MPYGLSKGFETGCITDSPNSIKFKYNAISAGVTDLKNETVSE